MSQENVANVDGIAHDLSATNNDVLDVLVIGGGQAGLAIGYFLAERDLRFLIVDRGHELGHVWRSRWDSLRLFTAAQYNGLPGMPYVGSQDTYPGKDEIADFLRAYAAKFDLPVQVDTGVTRLTKAGDAYVAETSQGVLKAKRIVVATGPFQVPFIPPPATQLDPELAQIHSAEYRNPQSVPSGRILVVGAANSGVQIALELDETRAVEISVGQNLPTLPQRPLGRDIWWWLTATRLSGVTVESRLGRRLSQRDVVIGGGLRELRKRGVNTRPRVASGSGRTLTFSDGTSGEYEGVIWATGFRLDHSWIEIPEAKDEHGQVMHRRGVTPSRGLYMLGLTWQHRRTSALLGWVGDDAAFLAEQIAAANEPDAVVGDLAPTGSP